MNSKLFIFGATLLLSSFVSYNRALPLRLHDTIIIDNFIYDVENFYLANVDSDKLNEKITDNVMTYLYLWQDVKLNWFFSTYLIVSIQDGVDSTTSTSAANDVQSIADRNKISELVREFARDLEKVRWSQANTTRFVEIANKLSPAAILGDLLEWKASKVAALKMVYEYIMADSASEESSKNLLEFLSRQYVQITAQQIRSVNLPIPVNTAAFKEKAYDNATLAIRFLKLYDKMARIRFLKSIYVVVLNGSDGMDSALYMKNFVSSPKYNVHWLLRKNPFPRRIVDFVHDLHKIRGTMDMNITLFEEKAAIDPALTTEFLNFYLLSERYKMLQEFFSIVLNGAEGMNAADYMEHYLHQNVSEASDAREP